MRVARPPVTVVIPVRDSCAVLRGALATLAAQRYDGAIDVLLVDGGSSDGLRALAARHAARVLDNPRGDEEAGRAIGVAAATGELVLLLDADDELPTTDWLERLSRALKLAPDVVGADCLHHEHRPSDPAVVRLCALMGGSDPVAVELGWADRWSWHMGRWTGMPILAEERVGEALLVRIDPDRPPPMGSNGFLVKRAELLKTGYAPEFVHSDCVGDLAALGHRFARVDQGVVHLYAPDLRTYWRKANRRALRSMRGVPVQRRGYRPGKLRTVGQAAFSASVVGPALLAARGYRRRPDRAWALYPLLSLMTIAAYVNAAIRVRTGTERPLPEVRVAPLAPERRSLAARLLAPLNRLRGTPLGRKIVGAGFVHRVYSASRGVLVRERWRFALNALRGRAGAQHYHLRDDGTSVFLRHADPDDAGVFDEVIWSRCYEPPDAVLAALSRMGSSPLRVLDLGAHIGLFAIAASRRWPGARVTAVEADALNAALCKASSEANGYGWEVADAFAATRAGAVPFRGGLGVLSSASSPGDPDAAAVAAIDVLPLIARCELLKMDIEGGEWAILGDSRFAAASPPALVLEFHARDAPGPDIGAEVQALLTRAGYAHTSISLDFYGDVGVAWAWR